jgi:hypothetical protein
MKFTAALFLIVLLFNWDDDFSRSMVFLEHGVIFVRQCYIDLYALCRKTWDAGQHKGFYLKGTPGIGKSFFFGIMSWVMSNRWNHGEKALLLSGTYSKAWLCSGFDRPAEICSLDTALTDQWAKRADLVLFDPHEEPQTPKAWV